MIDFAYLGCNHHKIMSLGVKVATQDKQQASGIVIGLGGGGLCTFLRKFARNVRITAVDVDPDMLEVAKNWFGLKQDAMLAVEIADGIKFLETSSRKGENIPKQLTVASGIFFPGEKYDAVLFDVDSKDTTIGMSCPPKEFLEQNVLKHVKKLLHENGLFVLNLVLRDKALKTKIMEDLQANFKLVKSYNVEDDLNEILMCTVTDTKSDVFDKRYAEATGFMENFLKKHNK